MTLAIPDNSTEVRGLDQLYTFAEDVMIMCLPLCLQVLLGSCLACCTFGLFPVAAAIPRRVVIHLPAS